MASILFLAPADLGETILASGALAHVLSEGDALTVFCESAAQRLFRAIPQLRAISSPPPGSALHAWAGLGLAHLGRRFDLVLDLRGGLGGYLIGARRRIVRRTPERPRHLVEDFSDLVGAERPLAPRLWIDAAAREAAAAIDAPGQLLVLAPGGADEAKRWPAERFAAVARRLVGGPLAQAAIVAAGAGARDAAITRGIVSSLDADGIAARGLGGDFDLLAAAALLERATLCIGNDNALTHLAAAGGAATLTLFGPTDERVRAPYGPRTRTLRGLGLEEAAASSDSGMASLTIDAVESAALAVLQGGGLR